MDLFDRDKTGHCRDMSRDVPGGTRGHGGTSSRGFPPLGGTPDVPLCPSAVGEDKTHPADAYRDARTRRAAFAAWEAAGSPWPPPAGLLSACLGAAMKRPGKPGPKWGRR